ncbi:hypothetical protein RBB76_06930 [Tunturiibacter psychrotolerans]
MSNHSRHQRSACDGSKRQDDAQQKHGKQPRRALVQVCKCEEAKLEQRTCPNTSSQFSESPLKVPSEDVLFDEPGTDRSKQKQDCLTVVRNGEELSATGLKVLVRDDRVPAYTDKT